VFPRAWGLVRLNLIDQYPSKACTTTKPKKTKGMCLQLCSHILLQKGPASRRQQSGLRQAKCAKSSLHVFLVNNFVCSEVYPKKCTSLSDFGNKARFGMREDGCVWEHTAAPAAIRFKPQSPINGVKARAWFPPQKGICCELWNKTSNPPDQKHMLLKVFKCLVGF
jgi:hypothetical protein